MDNMKLVSKTDLEQWGSTAATEYITNDVPLNETIEKIASENELNNEQVKRVCEFANISTNLQLFDKMEDKRFKFAQAKHSDVLRSIERGDVSEKTASMASNALSMKVPNEIKRGISVKDSLRQLNEKVAEAFILSRDAEDPDELLKLLESKQAAIEEIKMDKVACDMLVLDAEESVYEEMKARVLGGDNSFNEFCSVAMDHAKTAYDKGTVKEALIKAGYRLVENLGADQALTSTMSEIHNTTITKTAMQKLAVAAPDEYIADTFDSPGVPVVVRNGNLNIYYVLDTLVKQKERSSSFDRPLLLLDDDVRYIKRKLTA